MPIGKTQAPVNRHQGRHRASLTPRASEEATVRGHGIKEKRGTATAPSQRAKVSTDDAGTAHPRP